MSAIRTTGGSTVRTADPAVFPTKTDPVTGDLIVPLLPTFKANKFIIAELVGLPPTLPTDASTPEAAASDVAAAAAAAGGYTLSDLAAGAGSPTVGLPASKDSLKTLDTSTSLTDLSGSTVQDNTYLYLGIGIAAVGGLYFYSQTAAGKKVFAKPR